MESNYIYHVTTKAEWEVAQKQGFYLPKAFDQDGFMHCSVERQIPGVLDRFYKGVSGLVKLKIEKQKVDKPVLFELAHDINELFPHIYGPLNIDAVVEVVEIS
jgi:uncharacterized protein (DUF952 family)